MRRFRFESIPGYVLETELMSIVQKPTHGMPLKAFVR
jgi:hypothetical protein